MNTSCARIRRGYLFSAALLVFLLGTPRAHAGFQLEPYLGFWSGKLERDTNYYMATSGLLLGSRLGLGFGNFKAGLDLMYSSGSGNQSGSTGEYTITEYGPYVGLDFPGFGQLYGSVFIASKAKIQPDVNPNPYTGSGFRIGVGGIGWAQIRFLSLNLELISRSYSNYNNNALSVKQKETSFALTMSMPIPPAGSRGGYSPPSPSE